LGEVLLKLGQVEKARQSFRATVTLGYEDDLELMLQIGRALFREGLVEDAKAYFEIAVRQAPDNAEAVALVAYAQHRLNDDDAAIATLRRALRLDPTHAEARIYLGNILYDRDEKEAALYHLDRSSPDDHWDELGIWRVMELKRSIHRLPEDDPEMKKWELRIAELAGIPDSIDEMLAEIEQRFVEREQDDARQQLELFGAMLSDLVEQRRDANEHRVMLRDGRSIKGSWDEIVRQMKEGSRSMVAHTLQDFMANEARRGFSLTGVIIPTGDAESFIRGIADEGLLRILR
jgi:tetratricopeptide (TPR) repeat protein